MIKLIIVDDHKMVRAGLKKVLVSDKVADVIAEASNGIELMELLKNHKPDLLLMDVSMPEMDGIESTKKALELIPDLKILIISTYTDEEHCLKMIEAGAKGFVQKEAGIDELKKAILEISAGKTFYSPDILQKVLQNIHTITHSEKAVEFSSRELEILELICNGLTNEQIAEKIHLSYDTIKWHRSNILTKSGCCNTALLVKYAIMNKLVKL